LCKNFLKTGALFIQLIEINIGFSGAFSCLPIPSPDCQLAVVFEETLAYGQ
jgi:hypothetical protein